MSIDVSGFMCQVSGPDQGVAAEVQALGTS
jgi:hypothetical protein